MIKILGLNRGDGWCGQKRTVFIGTLGDTFRVRAHDLGNGHLEVTASRQVVWTEADWSDMVIDDYLEVVRRNAEENADDLRQRSLKSAARRAKNRVRRLCKAMGVDTMLTLTYRANQTDLGLCKKHVKEFNRRLLRLMPDFAFVAAFERQERGAWHVHLATRRVPVVMKDRNAINAVKVKSYDVIRAVWRSVVGDLGGNIDVARRRFHSRQTSAQIASYIAGYIVKEYAEGDKWSNRWTHYGDGAVPDPIDLGIVNSARAVVETAYMLVSDTARVCRMWMSNWQDAFFLAVEEPPDRQKSWSTLL